jgi:tRNA 2-thiouridine synthesizing protein A
LSQLIRPDRTLDARGLCCPDPVLKTAVEIGKLAVGQVLEVLADDPAAEEDIQSWVRTTGQQLLKLHKEGNQLRFLIKKVR